MAGQSPKIIADIQVLRAVAILMIVTHHLKALFPQMKQTALQLGLWAGVDLFFCISGFVIARGVLRRLPAETTLASGLALCFPFWLARFWRIMPSAIVWLGILLISTWLLSPGRLLETSYDGLAAILQVANLHFYNCEVNHQGLCGDGALFWTLSLEFQFYLLLPLFLLLWPECYRITGLALILGFQLLIPHSHWSDLMSFIRTDAFILGVLVAIFQEYPESGVAAPAFLCNSKVSYFCFILGVYLLCTAGNQKIALIPNFMALTTILSGALVWIASYDRAYLLPASAGKDVLLWIGSRSYAIYLLHLLTLKWVRWAFDQFGIEKHYILVLVCALVAIAIFAEISYRIIEGRFTSYCKKIASHTAGTPR